MANTTGNGHIRVRRLFGEQSMSNGDSSIAESIAEYYEPNHLLDVLVMKMRAETDMLLLHKLFVIQLVIKFSRKEDLAGSPGILLSLIHEATGMSIPELRDLLGNGTLAPDPFMVDEGHAYAGRQAP